MASAALLDLGLQFPRDWPASCDIVSNSDSQCHGAGLPVSSANVTVLTMYTVARMLQIAGLTIPLLSIIAQLNQQITLSQMLGFLAVSMGVFAVGYVLQRYSGGPS